MAELKTKQTEKSVEKFLNGIKDETKRKDSIEIVKLMSEVTKEKPKMWGTAIVGFGSYHYKYESGREGDACLTGFSPRKQNLTFYSLCAIQARPELLKKLGKFNMGKGCLYIKKLADVDLAVLKQIMQESMDILKKRK